MDSEQFSAGVAEQPHWKDNNIVNGTAQNTSLKVSELDKLDMHVEGLLGSIHTAREFIADFVVPPSVAALTDPMSALRLRPNRLNYDKLFNFQANGSEISVDLSQNSVDTLVKDVYEGRDLKASAPNMNGIVNQSVGLEEPEKNYCYILPDITARIKDDLSALHKFNVDMFENVEIFDQQPSSSVQNKVATKHTLRYFTGIFEARAILKPSIRDSFGENHKSPFKMLIYNNQLRHVRSKFNATMNRYKIDPIYLARFINRKKFWISIVAHLSACNQFSLRGNFSYMNYNYVQKREFPIIIEEMPSLEEPVAVDVETLPISSNEAAPMQEEHEQLAILGDNAQNTDSTASLYNLESSFTTEESIPENIEDNEQLVEVLSTGNLVTIEEDSYSFSEPESTNLTCSESDSFDKAPYIADVKDVQLHGVNLFSNHATLLSFKNFKEWKPQGDGTIEIWKISDSEVYYLLFWHKSNGELLVHMKFNSHLHINYMRSSTLGCHWTHYNYAQSQVGIRERLACRFQSKELTTDFVQIGLKCKIMSKKQSQLYSVLASNKVNVERYIIAY